MIRQQEKKPTQIVITVCHSNAYDFFGLLLLLIVDVDVVAVSNSVIDGSR